MTVSVGERERGAEHRMHLFTGALDGLLVPDDLPDGFVAVDDAGVIRVFNSAAAGLTGIRQEAALGRAFDDVLPFRDPDGRDWWQCTDPYGGLCIRTGHPETRLTLAAPKEPGGPAVPAVDPSARWDAMGPQPRRLEPDRELLVTTRYVRKDGRSTPVTSLVMSLRGTAARRRADKRQADLIATVAHELRSPLTSVKGFTATLLARWHRFTDDQKQMMLHTVDADADRVVRLIAELLDVARLDSGRMELHRISLDLHTLIADQVEACVAGGVEPDRFRIDVPRDLPPVAADPDKLRQVLANLLENAVRHGGGTVTISAEAEIDRSGRIHTEGVSSVAVAVSDEGPGIPEDQLNRVFTRFWRGSRRGGTGLGLSIVKGLVEAHGGSVAVDRAPSGGARFRFTLPVAQS
jgi:signal transduction histidine kinase